MPSGAPTSAAISSNTLLAHQPRAAPAERGGNVRIDAALPVRHGAPVAEPRHHQGLAPADLSGHLHRASAVGRKLDGVTVRGEGGEARTIPETGAETHQDLVRPGDAREVGESEPRRHRARHQLGLRYSLARRGPELLEIGLVGELQELRRLAVERRDIRGQHPGYRARPAERPDRRSESVPCAPALCGPDHRHGVARHREAGRGAQHLAQRDIHAMVALALEAHRIEVDAQRHRAQAPRG